MKFLKTEEKKENFSKEIDKKSNKKVFINLLIAIAIMAYFCILSVAYKQWVHENIVDVVKVTTMVFLAISLILIEIAYKKESKTIAIHAFEILALSIHSLTTMHVTKINNFDFNNYILMSSYGFSIYYVLKTIIIATKSRKQFLNGLSDIPEIVQKEEPKKKEASKKDKKKKEKESYKEISSVFDENDINEDDEVVDLQEDKEFEEALDVIANEPTEHENEDDKSITNDKLAKLREKLKRLQEIDEKLDKSSKQEKEEKNNLEVKSEKKNQKNNRKEEIKEEKTSKETNKKEKSKTSNKKVKEVVKETEVSENKTPKRGRPKKLSTEPGINGNIAKETRNRWQ